MKLNEVGLPAGRRKRKTKRLGRGDGSGHGGTSTKGHKGQRARAGGYHKVGFEGGQMPLQRRIPKFGFKNTDKVYYKAINLDTLEELAKKSGAPSITVQLMVDNGIVGKNDRVKVLGRGELKSKVTVEAHAFSATATKAIETAGGSATTVK